MFAAHHYESEGQLLVAACDPDLLDTSYMEGPFRLEVPSGFYDGVRVDEEGLRSLLSRCTLANLVGARTIAVAQAMGLVEDAGVRHVDGVPHAQLVTL